MDKLALAHPTVLGFSMEIGGVAKSKLAFSMLAVMGILVLLAVFLVPSPSIAKSLVITNQSGESVQVSLAAQATRSGLVAELPVGHKTNFVYFRGDYGGLTSVVVTVDVVGHSTGRRFHSTLELAVEPRSSSTNFVITPGHMNQMRQ